jgi:hypothetical protein
MSLFVGVQCGGGISLILLLALVEDSDTPEVPIKSLAV